MAEANIEVYLHVRVIMGMVVSLSLARLLNGLATIIQHPGRNRVYLVHLAWVASMFLFLMHFWWWEFRLQTTTAIDFGVYLFLVSFSCLFYFLCVLLFPTTLEDYGGYEEYFISRRRWFFGLLAAAYAIDLADTALKGSAYFGSFGLEYPLRNVVYILLCGVAMATANRRFHAAFVALGLMYQISWTFRLYDMLG